MPLQKLIKISLLAVWASTVLITGCGSDPAAPNPTNPASKFAPFGVRGGSIATAVHAGSSWYIGGNFLGVNAHAAPNFISLTATGEVNSACALNAGGFNGGVTSLAQSGNSLYVGGNFTTFNGQSANYLAKIDATTCVLDTTFSPPSSNGFNTFGTVYTVTISGSSLYVGGNFTGYRGVANSANHLAKLDLTTGAIDTTFSPVGMTTNGFDSLVSSLAVSGSSLYVGGNFTAYKGVANSANRLAKLDLTSGIIDTTFSPVGATSNGFNTNVNAVLVSGTSLYVGGNFVSYKGVLNSAFRVAKLDLTSGAIDTTFAPVGLNLNGFNAPVRSLVTSGTSLYVGGDFTNYKGIGASANAIAKLDLSSGLLDTTFGPAGAGLNGFVREGKGIASQVDSMAVVSGSLYAGGTFTTYRGVSANNIAKVDLTTGAQDTTFLPAGQTYNGFDGISISTILASGNNLYLGGSMSVYGGLKATSVAKLDDTTFALDISFNPQTGGNGFNAQVASLASAGTSLYVGGQFTSYRGVANSANRLAKLDLTSGAIDATFSPVGAGLNGFDNNVRSLVVAGSSLYVGGAFTSYQAVANSANYLAKLDLNSGAIDTTFSPPGATTNGFGSAVLTLATAGTSLYAGGSFTTYRGVANSALYVAKLDLSSGAIDTTFSPPGAGLNGFDASVGSLLAVGNNLYVGGSISAYKGVANSSLNIAKLDRTTGAIDATFSPVGAGLNGFNGQVAALASDGVSLFAGGNFTAYKGVVNSANRLAKLDLASGAIDATFSPVGATANGFNNSVAMLGTANGYLYVGGSFTTYRGAVANVNALLNVTTGAQVQ